jgi:putative ABC transport system permease protein
MNSISRGLRNAFRNPTRTISIVLILALSIGLIIAMLAARQAVDVRIQNVKGSVGNTVSISPAGVRGLEGGGSALTETQLASVSELAHVTGVTKTLSDRLTTSTSNLQSGINPGELGMRRSGQTGVGAPPSSSENNSDNSSSSTTQQTFTMPVEITGISNASEASTYGGSKVTWKSGKAFDASKDENVAVVGTKIASKNNLSVGSTFTAYGTTIKVVGIYDAGTDFANNGVFVSLAALQRLSDQSDQITSATATVDSLDNLSSVTSSIKSTLGSAADVTSSQDTANQLVQPLESVKSIALFSLIGAAIAGSVIILLTMLMIVRERRREIGVMKAIGASKSVIIRQFVAESVTLMTLGLVVGVGLGVVAATPLTNMLVDNSNSTASSSQGSSGPGQGRGGGPGLRVGGLRITAGSSAQVANGSVQASVGLDTIGYGLLAALLIATIGSAVPAYFITTIKPAEAMRNE